MNSIITKAQEGQAKKPLYILVLKSTCLSVEDAIDKGWLRADIDGVRTLLCLVRAHNLLNRELPNPLCETTTYRVVSTLECTT